jgi:hypothetical protein
MKKIQNYTGTDSENPNRPEIEHFGNCDVCGALVEMRDLAKPDPDLQQARLNLQVLGTISRNMRHRAR